jgi:hypothetical protein
VTNIGDWSWKPQPIRSPAARSAINVPATTANDTSTPPVYAAPCHRMALREALACWTRPRAFTDRTGSTHGIRFRTRPPASASTSASQTDTPAVAVPGVARTLNA